MSVRDHSTIREGFIAGLLGAMVVAVWYFGCDAVAGEPLRTPDVLGKVLFGADPRAPGIMPGAVAGYTLFHLAAFVVAGVVLTLLVHLTTRNLALRMGLWIGLVVAFSFLAGVTYMLDVATGERVPLWSVVGGTLVGVVTMGTYLWRRHPQLRSSAPLGDETRATPHAPGAPRG